jgi:hypothetical protein
MKVRLHPPDVFLEGAKKRKAAFFLCFILAITASGMPTAYAAPGPEGQSEQEQAKAHAAKKYSFIAEVEREDPVLRKLRLHRMGLDSGDITHEYFLLSSPVVNADTDTYQPVRFMHSKHACALNDNCAACHHYRPADKEQSETVACRACHKEPSHPQAPSRVGLKSAYHQKCMGCHQDMKQGPTGCQGCHRKNPQDHTNLVNLPDDPQPREVTKACLRCHEDEARDFVTTAHWLWKGPASYTVNRQHQEIGKANITLNNF